MNYYLKKIIDILTFRFYKQDLNYYGIDNIWLGISSWISILLMLAVFISKVMY